jgi:RNA polymerase sigma-70 factor (ECF subfamily)
MQKYREPDLRLVKHTSDVPPQSDVDTSAARAVLEAALRERWRPLVAYVAGILGGHDDAEDIVQDAFIRLWSHQDARRSTDSAVAFLYRVARNLALNERRWRRVRLRWREVQPREESGSARADDATHLHELQAAVTCAIAKLPSRRREVFLLVRHHGLTHRQVAEALGISSQTVSNHMATALEQLRAALAPYLTDPCVKDTAGPLREQLSRVAGDSAG